MNLLSQIKGAAHGARTFNDDASRVYETGDRGKVIGNIDYLGQEKVT